MIPYHHPCLSTHLWEIWLILEFYKAFHSSRSDNELKFEGESVLIGFAPLDQGFLSIFGQLAACKVSDLLHGMTDLMCRAESLVCRKQIAGLLSALGNHTTSTQQMGGDIYKCERRALLHVSSRLPQVPTKVWKENELEIQRSNLFRGCRLWQNWQGWQGWHGWQGDRVYRTVGGTRLYLAVLGCPGYSML